MADRVREREVGYNAARRLTEAEMDLEMALKAARAAVNMKNGEDKNAKLAELIDLLYQAKEEISRTLR